MSGRSYPIWNAVTACIYKSSRSWGAKADCVVNVLVGTSASNSHEFVRHTTTHRVLENGDKSFRFYVDSVCVRQATLVKQTKELVVTYAVIEPVPTPTKVMDAEDAA
tara:strand:+ start:1018 stop:1338 length:321 start_codon:yes stop_codon:yes gene_type:complete